MTESFISLVARDILKIAGGDLRDFAFVFPNLRSGGAFRQELVRQISTPSWSPGIYSIDDWLIELSALERIDRFAELATLFQVVKQKIPPIESFADFIDLGETILADFDDVDKYLADPLNVFTTLHEIKKIDSQFNILMDEELVDRIRVFWSGFGASQSSHQQKWLEIWDRMYPVYEEFSRLLLAQGIGTSGMCYRKAADDIIHGRTNTGPFKKVVFVGFNILTAAEETIFTHLKNLGKALFYWDYHPYYLNDPHEAGRFIRQNLSLFPPPEGFQPFSATDQGFFQEDKGQVSITVVPVTSNTGQVQSLLNELITRPVNNRGIVLSDESLFSDLLSSWPDDKLAVNFTSGYPLRDTQAAGLFKDLLGIWTDMDLSDEKFCKSDLILSFLRHPWSKWLMGSTTDLLVQAIQRRYPESVPAGFLDASDILAPWIGKMETRDGFFKRIKFIGSRLVAFETLYNNIEKASIETIARQAVVFSEISSKFGLVINARTGSRLFSQFINSSRISLETNRDANNQVTGILETRLVDFEEVFILSFNEGIWPSKNLPGSLIPYSMRKIFHLPTADNRDAMYAYYFYRLIQRAESVVVYYLTGHMDDVIRSGEKSRYITQLEYELSGTLKFRTEPPVRAGILPIPIVIRKEGLVKERLYAFIAGREPRRSLSPSAINEYLDCSLQFALKRIYGFKEPEEVTYASDPKGFGILIHQVMNRLYLEFAGKDSGPDEGWYRGVLKDQDKLKEMINGEYHLLLKEKASLKSGGKELLAMEVVRQFLMKILEFDQANLPLQVLGLEKKIEMEFPVIISNQNAAISLNGIIDRLDRVSGGIRIVDYKTGNPDLETKELDNLFDRTLIKRPKELFQVLLYCELYLNGSPSAANLIPCLFRVGKFRSGDDRYRLKIGGKELVYADIRDDFKRGVRMVLEELFNTDIPFVQCEDEIVCRYCTFSGLCSRVNYS
ncbi:MAG: PD-(D/E)XK nuclease family protein [Bacteroidales bacterium]|jgi:hypothetical protein